MAKKRVRRLPKKSFARGIFRMAAVDPGWGSYCPPVILKRMDVMAGALEDEGYWDLAERYCQRRMIGRKVNCS
jgi:hypothetical protein